MLICRIPILFPYKYLLEKVWNTHQLSKPHLYIIRERSLVLAESRKEGFWFQVHAMASRLLWASRAASYLRISAFQRGFASGISDFCLNVAIFVLMGGSLFAFHLYILIGKKMNTWKYFVGLDVDVDLSFMSLFKCLIYDSSSRIFEFLFEMGFVCFCHWFHVCQVLDFITAEIIGFLNLGIHIFICTLSFS